MYADEGVDLRNVTRSYGSVRVIENFSMYVQRGSIYALLGPSGCGKTTLLKMMLGRLEPDSGTVRILGAPPHTKGHHVPGARVGYAPQETALYMDITIRETLQFHASMHGMSASELQERKKWLIDFLELPSENRLVSRLSGGQQRRVSLAVALLNNPEILILDEPTVGLDPLLRLRIWDHLKEIATTGVTVIITTHYIEEARQADNVGLMRHGRLLAEGNPMSLMKEHNHDTLEGVFLDLCRNMKKRGSHNNAALESTYKRRSINDSASINDNHSGSSEDEGALLENSHLLEKKNPLRSKRKGKQNIFYQIFAIGRRKITQLIRNPVVLFFEMLVPTIQILIYITCIGPDPKNLNFTIVNQDIGCTNVLGTSENLGNLFVKHMQEGNELKIVQMDDLQQAIDTVRKGSAWGTMYIPKQFSEAYYCRSPNAPLEPNAIKLYMDLSNYQVTAVLKTRIEEAFVESAHELFNTTVNPIEIVDPAVYGSINSKFSAFLAPGMISLISFAHSIGMTAVAFVRERTEATMDRIFAAGVKPFIFIAAHFLSHTLILLVQTSLLLLVTVFILKVAVVGNILHVLLLLLTLGFVGMSLGLVISVVAKQETEAVQIALAMYFPSLLLSGVLWPLEAVPKWFSWVSYSLPTTWVAGAMRSVMIRGWGITHSAVWMGYIVSFAWIVVYWMLATWLLSSRDKQSCWQKRKAKKALDLESQPGDHP